MPQVITLLTDFGTVDTYRGVMKGVILGINPEAVIVDLTHEVQPQNIEEAAYLLDTAYRYFPPDTVHVVVVDPGVGTARKPIAVKAGKWMFVAPNNGVLSPVFRAETDFQIIEVSEHNYMLPKVSETFHGRDIFAPAAAYLSLGIRIENIGRPVHNPLLLPPPPEPENHLFEGKVVHIDRFGNCITNIELDKFLSWASSAGVEIIVNDFTIQGLVNTYADAAPGEVVALFNSSEKLEIAANRGNAAEMLRIVHGCLVSVRSKAG